MQRMSSVSWQVAIVKLEADLIQKLSVKKLAYDDPDTDKTILASVDGEVPDPLYLRYI